MTSKSIHEFIANKRRRRRRSCKSPDVEAAATSKTMQATNPLITNCDCHADCNRETYAAQCDLCGPSASERLPCGGRRRQDDPRKPMSSAQSASMRLTSLPATSLVRCKQNFASRTLHSHTVALLWFIVCMLHLSLGQQPQMAMQTRNPNPNMNYNIDLGGQGNPEARADQSAQTLNQFVNILQQMMLNQQQANMRGQQPSQPMQRGNQLPSNVQFPASTASIPINLLQQQNRRQMMANNNQQANNQNQQPMFNPQMSPFNRGMPAAGMATSSPISAGQAPMASPMPNGVRPAQFNSHMGVNPITLNNIRPLGSKPPPQLPARPNGGNGQQQQGPRAPMPLPAMQPSVPIAIPVSVPLVPMASNDNASQANQPRPQTGFAPSGPPPTQSNPNLTTPLLQVETATTQMSTEASSSSSRPQSSSSESPSSSTSPSDTNSPPPTTTTTSNEQNKQPLETWKPLGLNETSLGHKQHGKQTSSSLAPSPDIVTVPPGYNPDQVNSTGQTPPATYDIAVSAQMGGPSRVNASAPSPQIVSSMDASSPPVVEPSAVTTIIWSPPPVAVPSSLLQQQQQSKTMAPSVQPSRVATPTIEATVSPSSSASPVQPNATRNRDISSGDSTAADSSVVYGKSQAKDAKPAPPQPKGDPGRPFIESVPLDSQVRPMVASPQQKQHQPSTSLIQAHKRPAQQASTPFKASKPVGADTPMSASSGFSIAASNQSNAVPINDIQDYLASHPQRPPFNSLSAPARTPDLQAAASSASSAAQPPEDEPSGKPDPADLLPPPPPPAPIAGKLRRPTFKPKPANPPIRIDSCIVGDDSSCDQSHNERCVTEYGISSCHCRPGFARLSQLRGHCKPIGLYQVNMRIERLADERKLAFNKTLQDPNSEEYQYLEFECVQALAWALQQTSLARRFMGAKLSKFFERDERVYANISVSLDMLNATANATSPQQPQQAPLVLNERLQFKLGLELARLANLTGRPRSSVLLGDTTIVLDMAKEGAISKLADVDECASPDLNDCSKHAQCVNEPGGFRCQCQPGYDDKHAHSEEPHKLGRQCLGCPPSYCSNRGECVVSNGQRHCKCRPNFLGARCDVDGEVVMVAVVGSLVGLTILVVTFWCLVAFNRKWKWQQAKLDDVSAASGLAYSYVNGSSATNSTGSLMSGSQSLLAVQGMPTSNSSLNVATARQQQHHPHHQYQLQHQMSQLNQLGHFGHPNALNVAPAISPCHAYQLANYQYDEAGLLIGPMTSSGSSSEQTSPSESHYRPHHGHPHVHEHNAYTLSGHHHHNYLHHHGHPGQAAMGRQQARKSTSQFQTSDYRTMGALYSFIN